MPFTNFPNGVTSFGIPMVGVWISIPRGGANTRDQGQVWFVDNVNGADGQTGTDPTNALKTIGRALTLAQSGTGDTIFVAPGSYTELVVVTKDYISIIGSIEGGFERPDIGGAVGVALTVTGQGFVMRNCRVFATGNADAAIQTGNGFEYSNCVFDGAAAQSAKALLRLLPSSTVTALTASEGQIFNNYFRGAPAAAFAIIFDDGAVPVAVGSTDNYIFGNRFSQNAGVDIATADSGGAGTLYSVRFVVIGPFNTFEDKNKATYMDFTTANGGAASDQSGIIQGNWFALDAGGATAPTTTQFKMVGTAFTFVGNYGTIDVMNGSGLD
jgi:hypothetical protein